MDALMDIRRATTFTQATGARFAARWGEAAE
jgi:hypothetical protein